MRTKYALPALIAGLTLFAASACSSSSNAGSGSNASGVSVPGTSSMDTSSSGPMSTGSGSTGSRSAGSGSAGSGAVGSSSTGMSGSSAMGSSGSSQTSINSSSGTSGGGSNSDCYVHLFDSDDFDTSDDNFKLTEPGEYQDLSNLPGANQDWTDEADSVEVGDAATVTIWSKKNMEGQSQELDPGKHSDIDEPSSLKLSCNA